MIFHLSCSHHRFLTKSQQLDLQHSPKNNLSYEISNDWIHLWNEEEYNSNTCNMQVRAKIWFVKSDKKKKENDNQVYVVLAQQKNVSQWLRAISDFIRKSMVTAVQIFNQSCRWHGKINWIGACKWVVVIPIYKPFMIYISRSNLHRPPLSSANQHDIMPWKIVLNMKFNIINFITMHEINGFAHDLI